MACDNRFLSRTEWITHYSETTRRPDWPRNAYRYSLLTSLLQNTMAVPCLHPADVEERLSVADPASTGAMVSVLESAPECDCCSRQRSKFSRIDLPRYPPGS
jgi:hypothetical protein